MTKRLCNKWSLFDPLRALGIALVGLIMLVSGQAFAQTQSPAGCNANLFSIDLSRDKLNTVPGDIVTYQVSVSNDAQNGSQIGCDLTNVTIVFTCPGNDGTPSGQQTTLVTNGSYPAPTASTLVGTVQCTMPNFQGSVQASVTATGDLQSTPGTIDRQTSLKTISVLVLACAVQVDKQISCDGGITWIDQGLQGGTITSDGTNACSGLTTDNIMVRYQVSNSGTATLGQCTLTDTNPAFGTPGFTGQQLAPGQTTAFIPGTTNPVCSTAVGGEPDTATINCGQCGGVTQANPITASDTATFQCLTVALKTDRNVDCGGGAVDMTLVTNNEDGTNGCSAPVGATITWGYQAQNNGTAPLYNCQLTDSNPLVSPNPINVGDLAAGDTLPFPATNTVQCSTALQTAEAANGKVTLACCTIDSADLASCPQANRVQVTDSSNVTCLAPDMNVAKLCEDQGLNGAVATITVQNTGSTNLVNCAATDTLFADSPTCPGTGAGTSETLNPANPFSIAAGGSQVLTGSVTGLTSNACNTVSVTCTVEGTAQTITRTASDICETPNLGCITRTPGFWGTHPNVTGMFLPLSVCGTTLENVTAGNGNSAIEAMCSEGKDNKILGPQETQLIRQCTAAALNLAATVEEGGNCGTGPTASITDTMAACCSGTSICTGDAVAGFSMDSCLSKLDAFNNDITTLDSDLFKNPGRANPSICQQSKNNGVVVSPTP